MGSELGSPKSLPFPKPYTLSVTSPSASPFVLPKPPEEPFRAISRTKEDMGIFEPFRAIGYTTTSVPFFSVQRLGTEAFVTVSVGKAFQIYNCAKLTLVLVGPQLPKKIRALALYRDYTFAAYGTDIAVFKRSHQMGSLF